jgi:hypothetical protein
MAGSQVLFVVTFSLLLNGKDLAAFQRFMKRKPVDSSSIISVGYDSAGQILELEFERGKVYQYFDVPEPVYKRLLESDSIGGFVNREIKDVYDYCEI